MLDGLSVAIFIILIRDYVGYRYAQPNLRRFCHSPFDRFRANALGMAGRVSRASFIARQMALGA